MFPGGERQPEAMLNVLLKIVEKTANGGATVQDLQTAYHEIKGHIPDPRTIRRFVRDLNEFFEPGCTSDEERDKKMVLPIARENKGVNRYRFTRELVPEQRLDPSQAILMALSLYPQQRNMVAEQFERLMKMVFDHALQAVKECYSLQDDIEKYVYVTGYNQAKIKQNNNSVSVILRAIRLGKRVRFNYTRLYDGETVKAREAEPYGLLCRHGSWYLVGFCHEARERRIFRIDLVENLRIVENSTYTIPADFSLKKAYGSSWGTWTLKDSGPVETVRLKVEPGMAKKFAVTSYHESQKVLTQADGSAEVTFEVTQAGEMIPWLLPWGYTVKVLEPQWLREKVAKNARSIVEMYAED